MAIEEQLKGTRVLKKLTVNSRQELLDAQDNLQKYLSSNDKKFLELYFRSLRKLTGNIDSIRTYENTNPSLKKTIDSRREEISKLNSLETFIDSVYKKAPKPSRKSAPLKIKRIDIQNNTEKFDVEIHHTSDSIVKKKLFSRLKDAIKGKVDIKRDTISITTKYGSSIDTNKIKADFDSIVNAVNNHYLKEIKEYQSNITIANSKNSTIYRIYDNLIVHGNDLMGIYDNTISDFNTKLEKEYDEQNSINNKVRRGTVLGLMILMFFVLIVITYYTKQSFLYERELKEANKKIGNNLNFNNRILGMLSHEIRAPLKIINIFIDRIRKRTDDESSIDYLNSIKFTNNSLLIQANQILEYAKNHEKKIELNPVEFNLRNEIDAILHVFQPYIDSRNNVFEFRNEIDPKTIVSTDNTKIHQIFTNILGNANKFTENGKIEVIINTVSINEKTSKLIVSVADTGIGISESDIEKIFEPYYQGMISDEVDNIGAGLGLNLCKEIIDLFQGNISVKSSLGKGTTVDFEINLICF
ncbi:MAG: sensor histidine kinase [Flavobacterium sp.]